MAHVVLYIGWLNARVLAKAGWLKMQNLNLTRWLKMVREALDEKNEAKRDHLLQAADDFLQRENLESKSKLRPLSTRRLAA
jgi:hypothetical protein